MNWFIIVFAYGICLGSSENELSAEFMTDVDSSNINDLVSSHRLSVILFYAPWCGHCKSLMGEYDIMCKDVQDTFSKSVMCGRLDCTKNDELCHQHGLRGYPTIKMLHDQHVCEFKGSRTRGAIFNWVRSLYYGTTDTDTIEKANELVKSSEFIVIGYFEPDHPGRKLIQEVACQLDTVTFATVSDLEISKHLQVDKLNSFNIIKDGAFVKSFEGITNKSELASLIFFNVNPLVADFNIDAVSKIFNDEVNYYLAFVYDSAESLALYKDALEAYAKNYSPKIRVFTVNSSDIKNSNIMEYFHIQKFPAPVFYHDETQEFYHYAHDIINFDSLVDFTNGCLNGTITKFIKREPVPENWNSENVKVLVVDNFDEVFKSQPMGVILFHAPWCGHCQALMPVWDELGEIVQKKYPGVFVAKVDHTANDIPGMTIVGYPTIVAFKSRTEKFYHEGDRDINSLLNFVVTKLISDEPEPEEVKGQEPEREDL